jgi:hypothetical protein
MLVTEAWRRRIERTWSNPFVVGAFLVFLWIEFRWWPAILLTAIVGVDQVIRQTRRGRAN